MSEKSKSISKPAKAVLKAVLKDINEKLPLSEMEAEVNDALMRAYRGGGEEESVQPFECPMPTCGSTEFKPIPASNGVKGPDGRSWIDGYECKGCSVRFGDLAKFSNRK